MKKYKVGKTLKKREGSKRNVKEGKKKRVKVRVRNKRNGIV